MAFMFMALSVISIAIWSVWPSLEGQLRGDLELMTSGREAAETKVIGTVDQICFDGGGAERDFLAESKGQGDSFTTSLAQCGTGNSCCNLASDLGGVVGLVKDEQIRCVVIDSFDFYLKYDRPFCVKPNKLAVSRKTVVPGEQPPGRPWVARAGRTSFEVGERDR